MTEDPLYRFYPGEKLPDNVTDTNTNASKANLSLPAYYLVGNHSYVANNMNSLSDFSPILPYGKIY